MKTILLLFFLFSILDIHAARRDSSRAELLSLLSDRKKLADEYYSSLDKKSGFFGNKTKNDLRDSQEKLVAIVKADNKIMGVLNRALDYKNFEKQSLSYSANSADDRIRNLTLLNDTLNKQVIAYSAAIKLYKAQLRRHDIYFAVIIILIISAIAVWVKKIFKK